MRGRPRQASPRAAASPPVFDGAMQRQRRVPQELSAEHGLHVARLHDKAKRALALGGSGCERQQECRGHRSAQASCRAGHAVPTTTTCSNGATSFGNKWRGCTRVRVWSGRGCGSGAYLGACQAHPRRPGGSLEALLNTLPGNRSSNSAPTLPREARNTFARCAVLQGESPRTVWCFCFLHKRCVQDNSSRMTLAWASPLQSLGTSEHTRGSRH